jgi:hypothetical protein
MRRKIILICLCVILVLLPTVSSISIQKIKNIIEKKTDCFFIDSSNDVPYWADGNFTGKWGMELSSIFLGKIEIELGNVYGYFSENMFGRLNGKFTYYWNETKTTNISGVYFGAFIFGGIGDVEINTIEYNGKCNESVYAGLGDRNETDFYFRLIGREGPIYYMEGKFNHFDL